MSEPRGASTPVAGHRGATHEADAVGRIQRLPVRIAREQLLRFVDYPAGHAVPDRIEQVLGTVLPEAQQLVDARGCFTELAVERAPDIGLQPLDADALCVGLVTAGAAIEQRAKALMDAGELTRGVLLDAAGSAAAEQAADLLGALIVTGAEPEADQQAAALGCRLSPGYGHWPLEQQPRLFALLPHAELGVSLAPSHMMLPRKSISFAMWLGARVRPAAGLAGCSHCGLEHCRYRRRNTHEEVEP